MHPEGLVTLLVSFVLYFAISDFPEEVKWLTDEEKEFVKARLYEDVGHSKRHDPLTFETVMKVFKDCTLSIRFGAPSATANAAVF